MTDQSALNPNLVISQKDFCAFVEGLSKEAHKTERSLEDYLRALWLLLQVNKDAKVSYTLLAQILFQALTSPVAPFENHWLNYTSPPLELGQQQPVEDGFGFLEKMILYQIADLHKMKEEGVLDLPPHVLWLGASRKNGKTWYNFVPSSFLFGAIGGLNTDSDNTDCDWSILAIFLWLGQIYE